MSVEESASSPSLEWIAEGCGVMGTGGGGSTYPPFLMARQLLRDGKAITVSMVQPMMTVTYVLCTGC